MKEAIEKVRKIVEQKLLNSDGCHDYDHTLRVYMLCLHLGKIEGADLNILKFAALLHDICRPEESKSCGKICHATIGAQKAKEILLDLKVSSEITIKVSECISSHRYRDDNIPFSLEAKIVYDADKLDSIGAVGIGRSFVFAGAHGARMHNPDVDIMQTKEYSREDTAYREYIFKLSKIKSRMLTKEGKRMAESRHKFMKIFFDRLNDETKGKV